jgi:alanine-synthesizing transaminase
VAAARQQDGDHALARDERRQARRESVREGVDLRVGELPAGRGGDVDGDLVRQPTRGALEDLVQKLRNELAGGIHVRIEGVRRLRCCDHLGSEGRAILRHPGGRIQDGYKWRGPYRLPPVPASRLHLSRRLPWEQAKNRLTLAVEERAARGLPAIDLTETNPTRVGLPYPEEELAELLRRGAAADYRPHARGLPEAREALAAALSTPGDPVAPDDLVLTASTSESYSYLFKLFADPGDEVLTAAPSYPLLDSLADLESLVLRHVYLEPGRRFDPEKVDLALSERTRLLALIHPGNPTGAFLSAREQGAILTLCAAREIPLISDEVFVDYCLTDDLLAGKPRAGPAAASGEALAFSLGGLSKSAGLPSWKLGWIRVGGPSDLRRRSVAALEMVADTYLSVATPVQRALPGVLALAPRIRAAIQARVRGNLAGLRAALAGLPAAELLEPEGGWAAVIRVSLPVDDEELALGLLARAGVLVHPGYYFDFATEGFLVLSLLPEPGRFAEGAGRLAGYLGGG